MIHAPASVVRHQLARAIVGAASVVHPTVGDITLRPHQRAAATRLLATIDQHGGALLAEPVGLGKTYTALAVATSIGGPLTLVVPSSLRRMWLESLERCGMRDVALSLLTHESLSRGARVTPALGLVIVDEAHRARTPGTRRYAALAELCKRARVLLVTATPVQNRRADLAAQLALFLGRRAWQMRDEELSDYVIRGTKENSSASGDDDASEPRDLPALDGPHRIELATTDECLDSVVALPPPVAAADEAVVTALLTYGLIHQWSSSRAALLAALTRRRARGFALLAALDTGRRPTHSELSAWTHVGDALQLALPELVVSNEPPRDVDLEALAVAVDRHNAGVEALIRRLRSANDAGIDPDDERALALTRIRERHRGERIIAFCHYAETVNALRAKLARQAGVAALTANGARVAGGRVSRDTVLAQFTPAANARVVPAAERIDLLLTTDLLSEGLNLQEASVVVHLDLPWNPARLDQRVGRVRRIGSRFSTVSIYAITPPAPAEALLRIEQRLRDKLSVARRAVGVAGRILPSALDIAHERRGLAEHAGAVESTLRNWLNAPALDAADRVGVATDAIGTVTVATVAADIPGWIAAIRDRDGPRLIAELDDTGISSSPDCVSRALELARGHDALPRDDTATSVLSRIAAWLDARRGASTIDLAAAVAARSRRTTLLRVSQTLERAPRHRRAQLAPLAEAARAVVIAPLAEGAERILETLAKAELPDEAWLRSVATFGALNARPPSAHRDRVDGERDNGWRLPRVEYLIVFQRPLP